VEIQALVGRRNWKRSWWIYFAPLLAVGCASTDGGKSSGGMASMGNSSETSWADKLAAPFKSKNRGTGGEHESRSMTANDKDTLSLKNKPDKKNPDLIVAIAQMQERAGNMEAAEKQYQKALKLQKNHLGALVGYARLHDQRGKMEEATKLYQKAVAAHPQDASAHNDLGLCYHRRGRITDAQASLAKAVELAPERKLYRNNLAAAYVEQGQIEAALTQMIAAHGPAAGNYNIGFLLAKKGDNALALPYFRQAAAIDPNFKAAQQMVAKLAPQTPVYAGNSGAPATVAQRTPIANQGPSVTTGVPQLPSGGQFQPAANYQGAGSTGFSAPPAAVRYPSQQTSGYTGTAALPPSPGQLRQQ
jgi:Tfp pilus assembly protein PilF